MKMVRKRTMTNNAEKITRPMVVFLKGMVGAIFCSFLKPPYKVQKRGCVTPIAFKYHEELNTTKNRMHCIFPFYSFFCNRYCRTWCTVPTYPIRPNRLSYTGKNT
jgi:hypothetical protein